MNVKPLADIYTGGYAETRRLAQSRDPRALAEVAKQFEAYFLQQMLKSMRDASFGDPLFDSSSAEFYREIFDQQMSLKLAEGKGIGFADLIQRSIPNRSTRSKSHPESVTPPKSAASALPNDVAIRMMESGAPPGSAAPEGYVVSRVGEATRTRSDSAAGASMGVNGAQRTDVRKIPDSVFHRLVQRPSSAPSQTALAQFRTPGGFVDALWPHAKAAADQLGVEPDLLIAQSALETGWGKHVIPLADGRSSYNLFGIKADSRWSGPRVVKVTVEYEGGLMKQVKAPFRAYDNLAESFSDYVKFIQSNERYRGALAQAGDSRSYVHALQDAGYATDPRYAEKIMRLLDREPIRLASAGEPSS